MSQPEGRDPELGDRFHESAGGSVRRAVQTYAESIVRQAVESAHDRDSPIVLSEHVQDAQRRMRGEHYFSRAQSLMQILGALLVGIFLNGFISQILATETNTVALAIYVAIGFVGLLGVFWSIFR